MTSLPVAPGAGVLACHDVTDLG